MLKSLVSQFNFKLRDLFSSFSNKTSAATFGVNALDKYLPSPISLWLIKKPTLNWKVRAAFYQHLIDQVGNEIALEKSLSYFKERMDRSGSKTHAKTIALIINQLKNGNKFSQTLTGLVSSDEVSIIAAGETAGKLPFALELILEQHARADRLKQALREGFLGALFYFLITCGILWYIAAEVIPQLNAFLPMSQARGLMYLLFSVSNFVHSYWALSIPVLLIASCGALIWSLPRWTGRSRLVAERYFPYSYYRDLMGYQWLMVFATLLSSGIADVEILQMQSKGASPYLRERLSLLYHRLRSGGMSLGDALITPVHQGGFVMNFPSPEINESIVALYGFANFPDRITKLVSTWSNQIEARTLALTKFCSKFLENLLLFSIALFVLAMQDVGGIVTPMVR